MNFDDMTTRIIDKLDILDDKIDKLCQWKTQMETEWKTHTAQLQSKSENKEKKFYIIIAIMGVFFTLVEVMPAILP